MLPVEKFTDLDIVYWTYAGAEDDILEYVWHLAIIIHSAEPEILENGYMLEGSHAIGIFKKRYNEGLIKMPLSYAEYKKKEEIQPTIAGLNINVDQFWFLLLFIWDYTNGECFQAFEAGTFPLDELKGLIKTLSQFEEEPNANPLTSPIKLKDEITLSIQVDSKSVMAIKSPNTIKYILSLCQDGLEKLEAIEDSNKLEMLYIPKYKTQITASNTKQICIFARLFQLFFETHPYFASQNIRGNSNTSYGTTFLISKLIYHTKISNNENFSVDKNTLKGYLSKNRHMKWDVYNKIYQYNSID